MAVVLFEPATYFEGVFLSSAEVSQAWKQETESPDKDSLTVAEAYSVKPASDKDSARAADPAKGDAPAVTVADAGNVSADDSHKPLFPKVEPEPVFTLPKVRRVPGVAYAATPANAPRPGSQPNSLTLEALNRKQEELMRKEQDLKALQEELEGRFAQMQELEMRLQIMLRDAEEIKDARYRQLVDVLSNMKARQAAEVLSTLDEKVAVRVLAGMRGRQAGEILSFADPMKAARLTEALARMQMPLQ